MDITIIGGGVIGAAIAHFLSFHTAFSGRICVIERDPTYEICATTRSWGGIRHQFSLKENIAVSQYMTEFMQELPTRLAIDDNLVDIGFKAQGYLFLATEAGLPMLEQAVATQNEYGAATELLGPADLATKFPWLNIDDLAGAAFGPVAEGWLDPHALLTGYRQRARADGVEFIHDDVVALHAGSDRIEAVELKSRGRMPTGIVINAAGPWAGQIAAMVDIILPVEPRKRMTYVFDCRHQFPPMPLTINPSGLAFRPESGQFLALQSPPEDEDKMAPDLDLELTAFETDIWPQLATRVQAFEAIKLSSAWAGFYDYNFFDQNGIIGAHPELANFYFCNGFSGHGIQQAAAAGRAIMELITTGSFQSLDLGRFGYERVLNNRPIYEVNII